MKKNNLFKFIVSLITLFGCTNSIVSTAPSFSLKKKENHESNTNFEVHMLDLGNATEGESTIIKFGNTEVLIDAGGNSSSGDIIYDALNKYCEDKFLEYIIITHSHADHIINFHGKVLEWLKENHKDNNIKDENECTLIDFDILNDYTVSQETYTLKDKLFKNVSNKNEIETDEESEDNKETHGNEKKFTKGYINYSNARYELLEPRGKEKKVYIDNYYTSTECTWSKRGVSLPETKELKKIDSLTGKYSNKSFNIASNTANDEFILHSKNADNSEAMLYILYNFYYDHTLDNRKASYADSREYNNLSVCTLFEYNNEKFLFTGDLQEFNSSSGNEYGENNDDTINLKKYSRIYGESKLVNFDGNKRKLEGGVLFFKAAHHGSDTSNSAVLLDAIRPQYVGISAVATLTSKNDIDKENVTKKTFKFPKQVALDNMMKWTDYILITNKYQIDSDGKETSEIEKLHGNINIYFNGKEVNVENDTASPISVFENKWFIDNRMISYSIYNFDVSENYDSNCTYIKVGHIDILINAGTSNKTGTPNQEIINKIKLHCNDHILDYLFITNVSQNNYSELVRNKGINSDGYFKKIKNVILPDIKKSGLDEDNKIYDKLVSFTKNPIIEKVYGKSIDINNKSCNDFYDEIVLNHETNYELKLKLEVLKNAFIENGKSVLDGSADKKTYSMPVFISLIKNSKIISTYLNIGDYCDYNSIEESILKKNTSIKNNVDFLQVPSNGYSMTNNVSKFYSQVISPRSFQGAYLMNNGKLNTTKSGEDHTSRTFIDEILKLQNAKLYTTSYIPQNSGNFEEYSGDLRGIVRISNTLASGYRLQMRSETNEKFDSKNLSDSYSLASPINAILQWF